MSCSRIKSGTLNVYRMSREGAGKGPCGGAINGEKKQVSVVLRAGDKAEEEATGRLTKTEKRLWIWCYEGHG